MNIAINGFGRIGRCVLRAWLENNSRYPGVNITKINSTISMQESLHLLKYDSIFGRFDAEIAIKNENTCVINGKEINFISSRSVEDKMWDGVSVVMECTGAFTSRQPCEAHLNAGAEKVIISAPAKDKDIPTIVYGVNHSLYTKDMKIISAGSCTTNCLAPIAKILDETFGIESAFMTTIHSYTGDQNIVDGTHKDPRRARAAAMSMIPTSTGAAKSLSLVLPNLKDKIDGSAIRVPTPNVSVVDLVAMVKKDVNKDLVNEAFSLASKGEMKGVLGIEEKPLVSIDFLKSPCSSNVDLLETKVVANRCVRILSWYDNEWAFSMRMLDIASRSLSR